MKPLAFDLFFAIIAVFVLKMLAQGLTLADALSLFVILAGLLGKSMSEYLFTKRPDLFKEMLEVQKSNNALKLKIEEHESDITALKFGVARR